MDMIPYRMIALVLVVALLLTAVTPARAEALNVGGVWGAISGPPIFIWRAISGPPISMDLQRAEEVGDLERRGLWRVRAVDGVGLDGRGELLADGAGRRLGGIGGAHEIAPLLDAVVGLEHHRDARALRHERAEALEEGPRAVDGVEARRVVERHLNELGGEHLEARLLDLREDRAGGTLGDGVGLDDGQRALRHAPITSRRSVTWPT